MTSQTIPILKLSQHLVLRQVRTDTAYSQASRDETSAGGVALEPRFVKGMQIPLEALFRNESVTTSESA